MRTRFVGITISAAGIVLFMLSGCSGSQRDQPARVQVELSELIRCEVAYDDRIVETTGVVREYVEAERGAHYWIEDEATNRVGLRPSRLAAPVVDQTVEVVGRFSFSDRAGRVLTIERIRPLPASTRPQPETRASDRLRPRMDGQCAEDPTAGGVS